MTAFVTGVAIASPDLPLPLLWFPRLLPIPALLRCNRTALRCLRLKRKNAVLFFYLHGMLVPTRLLALASGHGQVLLPNGSGFYAIKLHAHGLERRYLARSKCAVQIGPALLLQPGSEQRAAFGRASVTC